MADLKLRSDAWSLARLVTAAGIDLGELKPGPDGWHSFASMVDGLAALKARNEQARRDAAAPPAPSMTPREAFDSARISVRSLPDWEARYSADPAGTGRVLASLAPVGGASSVRSSATPRLDKVMEDVYGPDHDERQRREDLQAEAELREAERQQVTASGLTDDEYRSLFPASGE